MANEGLKWRVNRAVRASALPAPSRLIMLVLSDMADSATAEIPANRTPSVADLARETGLKESAIKTHRTLLEKGGWLVITRPTVSEAARHVPSRYALKVGAESTGGQETTPESEDRGSRNDPRNENRGSGDDPLGGQETTPAGVTTRPPYIGDDPLRPDDQILMPVGALFDMPPKTSKPKRADPAARFNEFYKIYPRKMAPGKAERAWIKAVRDGAEPQLIIDVAGMFAMECKIKDKTYIPYPATWLNDKRWLDEPDPTYTPPAGAGGYQPWRNPITTSADDYTGPL